MTHLVRSSVLWISLVWFGIGHIIGFPASSQGLRQPRVHCIMVITWVTTVCFVLISICSVCVTILHVTATQVYSGQHNADVSCNKQTNKQTNTIIKTKPFLFLHGQTVKQRSAFYMFLVVSPRRLCVNFFSAKCVRIPAMSNCGMLLGRLHNWG